MDPTKVHSNTYLSYGNTGRDQHGRQEAHTRLTRRAEARACLVLAAAYSVRKTTAVETVDSRRLVDSGQSVFESVHRYMVVDSQEPALGKPRTRMASPVVRRVPLELWPLQDHRVADK